MHGRAGQCRCLRRISAERARLRRCAARGAAARSRVGWLATGAAERPATHAATQLVVRAGLGLVRRQVWIVCLRLCDCCGWQLVVGRSSIRQGRPNSAVRLSVYVTNPRLHFTHVHSRRRSRVVHPFLQEQQQVKAACCLLLDQHPGVRVSSDWCKPCLARTERACARACTGPAASARAATHTSMGSQRTAGWHARMPSAVPAAAIKLLSRVGGCTQD